MDMSTAREKLIQHLSREIRDRKVLETMGHIPRELFVPKTSRHMAYEDIPLTIGMGQTISQPLIVALMTESLELANDNKVLEIGTGSGYQTAILCEMAGWVVSVERHEILAIGAKKVLDLLGIKNFEIHVAESTLGWHKEAPYDAIIVTAGAPSVPPELLAQLNEGGRLVIPVGSPFEQNLVKLVKCKKGGQTTNLGPCRFVPLIGEGGW